MDHLLTEARNPASLELDTLTPLEIVHLMNAEDATVPGAVGREAVAIARAIEVIADRLAKGGRLIYCGAGTSGRLGVLDASECPPTFNSAPELVVGLIAGGPTALTTAVEGAEDRPEAGADHLRHKALCNRDVVVGIATSGRTPYVLGALRYARSLGAFTIGLACVPDPEIAAEADVNILPQVGPEILTGSTRLKAGTATKLVLNMLTTGAMVRLGKTFGNLMVDLRATNTKLVARTNRIVRQLLGVDEMIAAQLLSACGGDLKSALVVGRTGVGPNEARARLANAGGRIADVLVGANATPHHADLALGIDGGGTQTTALLARLGAGTIEVVGRGKAGPSNVRAVGHATAFAEIDRAIAAAFACANVERGTVMSACLGLAGAGRTEEQNAIHAWAKRKRLADKIAVVGDVELPLAMLPGGVGVVVIAGTGSCVLARGPDGRVVRAGGWGPLLGDQGSAYALVLDALQIVTRLADRRVSSSMLTDRLLSAMSLRQPSDLIAAVQGGEWDRTRLAGLAPVVITAADEGEPTAATIVERQVGELASAMVAAATGAGLLRETFPLAMVGGLLLRFPTYRGRLLERLAGMELPVGQVLEVAEPAQGAISRAADLAN